MTPLTASAARILAMTAASLLLVGCDVLRELDSSEGTGVDIALVNDADENIHLMEGDEEFATSNRVEPGKHRLIERVLKSGEELQFRAGRSGVVLAATKCTWTKLSAVGAGAGPLVIYVEDPSPALVCANWESNS
jgi:hypothetical protein